MEAKSDAEGRFPLTFGDEVADCLRADPELFADPDLCAEPERLVEAERRSGVRVPVHRPLSVDLDNGPVECVLVDVSVTGLALRLPRGQAEPPVGLGFVVNVALDAGTVQVTAEVVRTHQGPGPGRGPTVGARLTSGAAALARCLPRP